MAKSIELAYLRASTQQGATRDILRSRPSVFMGLHATDLYQLVRFGGRPGILIERIHDNSMLDAILASEDDIANNVVDSAALHASESPAGSGTPVDVAHPDTRLRTQSRKPAQDRFTQSRVEAPRDRSHTDRLQQ